MDNQKRENLLNLALDATPEEREKSGNLEVGYNPQERTWELIVRYSGDLSGLEALGVQADILLNGYAILIVPESQIEAVSQMPQIEYIEKPKRLFFAINAARSASCLTQVQAGPDGLSGAGTAVAVIDSGIDYFHQDFRREDGTTRIIRLWDQVQDRVYTEEEINEALAAGSRAEAMDIVNSVDISGHGTAVAGIAAGNGRESGGRYRGVAYESAIMAVRLGVSPADGFPRTTQLMRGLDAVVRTAMELSLPTAVNLSFGNTYGSHDGTSLLETYIDSISNFGQTVLAAGTGNEGAGGGHTSGRLAMGREENVELSVAPFETGFSVQLWKSYADQFEIALVAPSGESSGPISPRAGAQTFRYRDTIVLLYYGEPSPYSRAQEIYMDFLPRETYIDSGIWTIRLMPVRLVTGQYDLWLPSQAALNPGTRFLRPTPDTTLTIPSTAAGVISVGAYDDSYLSYADFSGRGYTRMNHQVKPDLVAPGVDIVTAQKGGGYAAVTGTSFATPFVSGSAALLMEWGIVRGNDPFLYGEKVKAYLIRGARQLPGFESFPNPMVGYGALCVQNSLPD
ncbi:MAG: S8 family serine peptidase [Clostridium sp.]|nr:S8 family serine peptidase [Clostridium sp.]